MSRLIPGIVAALLLGAGFFIRSNYDSWFVFPEKRAYINDRLKDPVSTQFRKEKLRAGILCGELNSKNSSGGYVGFKRYISNGRSLMYLEDEGPLGEQSHSDIMARLEEQNAILREFVELQKDIPSATIPTDTELYQQAQSRVFQKRWDELCT